MQYRPWAGTTTSGRRSTAGPDRRIERIAQPIADDARCERGAPRRLVNGKHLHALNSLPRAKSAQPYPATVRPTDRVRKTVPSYLHPLALGIVHRAEADLGRDPPAGDLDCIVRVQHLFGPFAAPIAGHIAKADGGAQGMPVRPGGQVSHDLAVAEDRLVMMKVKLRFGQAELHQSAIDPCLFLSKHRVSPDEITLLGLHGEAEPGFENVIFVGDIVSEMPKGLFQATGVHRVDAAELQTTIRPCLDEGFEDMGGLVGRDVDLPSQFADIGNAVGPGEAHSGSSQSSRPGR